MLPGEIAYMIDTIRETLIKNLEIRCEVIGVPGFDQDLKVELYCEGKHIDSDLVSLSDLQRNPND